MASVSQTPPIASSSNLTSHLSYPSTESDHQVPPSAPSEPRQILKDRLYVGNLHPTVDEYTLLQIFSKFGKVTKLDFLFHKAGVMKGKPRGYAFVEYGNQDDAQRALGIVHDKLLRGRKLVVTFAHQAPLDQASGHGGASRYRKILNESGRPTTLSILKSGTAGRNEGTKDKIAMMEAKLQQMEKSNPNHANPSSNHLLPPKPPPTLISEPNTVRSSQTKAKSKRILPSLPILAKLEPAQEKPQTSSITFLSTYPNSTNQYNKNGLSGVRLRKSRDK